MLANERRKEALNQRAVFLAFELHLMNTRLKIAYLASD